MKKQMSFEEAWAEVQASSGDNYFTLYFEANHTASSGITTNCKIFFYDSTHANHLVSGSTWDAAIDEFRGKMFPVANIIDLYTLIPHLVPQEVAA